MCSFRLFGLQKLNEEDVQKPKVNEVQKPKDEKVQKPKGGKVQKPKEDEVWSTKVTKKDLKNAVEDEFGVKYSKDWKRLLKAPGKLKGEYHIREGVKVIGDNAFYNLNSLTNINIPDSVTNIGNGAFCRCESLNSINIPNSVTNIGNYAFCGCESLTSINIPNSVTNIGSSAFSRCESLTSINIPNSVTSIGQYAFYNCTSLTDVYYDGTETEWKKISIDEYGNGNIYLTNATIHFAASTKIAQNIRTVGWYTDHILYGNLLFSGNTAQRSHRLFRHPGQLLQALFHTLPLFQTGIQFLSDQCL